MTEKDLKRCSKYFKGYTELRVQENRVLDINLVNNDLISNENTCRRGVSARVYKGGAWGFFSTPEVSSASVKYSVLKAASNAEFLGSREKSGIIMPKMPATHSVRSLAGRGSKKAQDEVDFARKVEAHIKKKHRFIKSRRVWITEEVVGKQILTSDGTTFESIIPNSRLILFLSAEKNGSSADLNKVYGGCGSVAGVFSEAPGFFEEVDALCEHAIKKTEGVFPVAGETDCILSPELTGLLAHEAIGHGAEADMVLGGALTSGLMGKRIASPQVSLVDFAHTALGKPCPAPVFVDDEGVEAEDVVVIEKGILKSYLHNRESAAFFGVKPAGNSRAREFSDEPVIRMRNTAILPGAHKLESMISSIKNGYYFLSNGNGQADLNLEFMFGVQIGYEIKNGKIGRAIKSTSISGSALEVLKSVTMVSDKLAWLSGGMCGKKQWNWVGMGGAALKCRVNVGGR